jgi:hypothetical protein
LSTELRERPPRLAEERNATTADTLDVLAMTTGMP